MKEVILNILERILVIGIFNNKESKTDIETLRAILDDVKEISLSDDEKKEINFRDVFKNKNGVEISQEEYLSLIKSGEDGSQSLAWDKSVDKTVKLSVKSVEFILNFIKVKSDNKELGVGDAPLLSIEEKLK